MEIEENLNVICASPTVRLHVGFDKLFGITVNVYFKLALFSLLVVSKIHIPSLFNNVD